jgi:putative transposase
MACQRCSRHKQASEKKAKKRSEPVSPSKSASEKCRETGWKTKQKLSVEAKRVLIEPGHPELSIAQQCQLLGLARSSYYYEPVPESEENLMLMRLLDEQDTRTPFYGARKMAAWLNTQGDPVERKRVRRL